MVLRNNFQCLEGCCVLSVAQGLVFFSPPKSFWGGVLVGRWEPNSVPLLLLFQGGRRCEPLKQQEETAGGRSDWHAHRQAEANRHVVPMVPCSSVHKTRQLLKILREYRDIFDSPYCIRYSSKWMYWKRACIRVQNTNCRLDVSRLCDFDLHICFLVCFDAETFSDCHIFECPVGVAQNRWVRPHLWFESRCNLRQSPIYIHVAIFMLAKGAIIYKKMLTNNAHRWYERQQWCRLGDWLRWINYWNLDLRDLEETQIKWQLSSHVVKLTKQCYAFVYTWYCGKWLGFHVWVLRSAGARQRSRAQVGSCPVAVDFLKDFFFLLERRVLMSLIN